MSGHDDPRTGSGRGGSLGSPAMGDPPEELRPDEDPEEGYVVSGGGVAHPADDDDPTAEDGGDR